MAFTGNLGLLSAVKEFKNKIGSSVDEITALSWYLIAFWDTV